ncbi:hypothetical protein LSG31_06745 [Fodinisporobacter ferrooxydans]|uniref:Uncharacterized protein n=1 Tax=Fodinisporobacter ferrooxydans TaxID=2901836 RepID=A0ABY4CN67_9BACL|nr:hypothetical protein LSG31_06745 [Alicyclobacillaceae bacterium MYW30-H2]
MEDFELLLMSWTQLTALEMIDPHDEHVKEKQTIEEALLADFDITSPKLINRTLTVYKVSYSQKEEIHEISFGAEEVESIYDL